MDTPVPTEIPEDWYLSAFQAEYPDVYAHRDIASAKDEARFIQSVLNLSEETPVLDLACGTGRHAAALADFGLRTFCLDLSRDLLMKARSTLRPENPANLEPGANAFLLVQADMRSLPFVSHFDVVFSFFSSFGYFLDEEDDRQVLAEVWRVLNPEGHFVLDFLNASRIKATLSPTASTHREGMQINEKKWISADGKRVNKEVELIRSDFRRRYVESVRLYSHPELNELLRSVGFRVEREFGDFDGSPYETDSPRLILIAGKS